MAIPADPTVTSLITDGMKEAGQYNVSATQTTNFQNAQFQTLKTVLWSAARFDRLLEKTVIIKAAVGQSLIALPTDFDHVSDEGGIKLYYPVNTTYTGTATAGGANTITVASTFSAQQTDVQGLWIFILSGTGALQRGQITAYNDTTKVVTVNVPDTANGNWATNPDNTSYYLIGLIWRELKQNQDVFLMPPSNIPRYYYITGDGNSAQIFVQPSADSTLGPYAIVLKYGANLTRLDETSSMFIQHMRERRYYWMEGIKWLTQAFFQDEREPVQRDYFNNIVMMRYAAQNTVIDRAEARR